MLTPPTEVSTGLACEAGLLEAGAVVTLTAGEDYPLLVETTRHDGAIDTTIAQAPRRRR